MFALLRVALAAVMLALPFAAGAQVASPRVFALAPLAPARTIVFVGNSFTYGALSPVERFRPTTVVDLNGGGVGGVPALFKAFTAAVGLDYRVALETVGGAGLDLHWDQKRALLDRPWDVVVLQGYSTLDEQDPGNGAKNARYAGRLAEMLRRANPDVRIELVATWSRADQVWQPGGHWYGKPIDRMARDLQRATVKARRATPGIAGVIPVGLAWNRAFKTGLADANPYDGIDPGRISLWAEDQYHASTAGYYLSALMIFGRITGLDPRVLTRDERAARDLGLPPHVVAALQDIAQETLEKEGGAR